jgi:DNA-binding response OmpR family regulator
MAQPIIIVEDDPNIAELLQFVFRRDGFAPQVLADGRAAEQYVASHPPAGAAVLDVMLPYRDGFAVANAIRSDARWRDVPIVMLSARTAGCDVEQARRLGVAEYVAKPFQPRAVVARVKALLAPGAQ